MCSYNGRACTIYELRESTESECARLVNAGRNTVKIHSAASRRAELPCRTVPCVLEKYLLIPQCRFRKRRKSLIRLWEIRSFIRMENCRAWKDASRLFFRLFFPELFIRRMYVIHELHWIVYKYIVREIVSIENAYVITTDKLHCDTFAFIIVSCFNQSCDFKIHMNSSD